MVNTVITMPDEYGNTASSLDYFLKFKLKKNLKIIDLGCGYGSLVYNLYLRGYHNIYGLDIVKRKIDKGKNNYPAIAKHIELYDGKILPFNDNYFDVVLMFDVIEHIPNVERFLRKEIHRVLKNDGLLIFQTPNKLINIPWSIINSKSLTKWKKYHCSLQTKGKLKRILHNSGFRMIAIEKYNIITSHNIKKVKTKLGYVGLILLYILQKMPLDIYPIFWGSGLN